MTASKSFQVRIVDIGRQTIERAKVRLSGEAIKPVDLKFDKRTGLYRADLELRGIFLLSVAADGLEGQERRVKLPHPATPEEFVLGKKGLPFYFRGKVKTPFEPKLDLIGVTLRAAQQDAAAIVEQAARALGLREVPTHEQIRLNNVRVFRYPARASADVRQGIFDALRAARGVQLAGPIMEMFEERLVYLTNQFVIKFSPTVTQEQSRRIAEQFGFEVVRPVPAAGNALLFQREARADYALLDAANALAMREDVEYAEPNAVMTSMLYAVNPADFLVGQQWHIPLIHLPDAWQTLRNSNAGGVAVGGPGDRTFGGENIRIVVYDMGIQSTTTGGITTPAHPDFQGNVTSGAPKVVTLYDFVNMVPNNNTLVFGSNHGMGCGGVVTAATNNPASITGETEGVAGAAGNCRLVGVCAPFGTTNIRWADSFVWMAGFDPHWTADGVNYPVGTVFPALLTQGIDIHTNSVRIPDVGLMDDTLDFMATYGRGGRGVVSFLAAGNTAAPISNPGNNTIADHEKVITVAASNNTDVRSAYSCFDPCIDVCAPSNDSVAGHPGIVTASNTGGGNRAGHTGGALDYVNNFGGTSSATPLAAGVGALMLSINPNLNWVQAREILRNTAVKIDAANTDPVGQWTTDGIGNPVFSQWYGYGRVDAAAAVAGAGGFVPAFDIVIRDNLADTGVVPSLGWHADSPDIWVRTMNDPLPVLAYTALPPHQNGERGQTNYVYLRAKNVGTQASNEVYLRASICHYPGFEFRYPNEWQPSVPPSAPVPTPLVPGSYLIGEELIDNLAAGADIIVKLAWDQTLIPPATVTVGGMPVTWHPCLLAEASPHDSGPSAAGTYDVKRYNDLAQKNITIEDLVLSSGFSTFGVVAGTASRRGLESLVLDRRGLSPEARVFVRADDPDVMAHWLKLAAAGDVKVAKDLPWRDKPTDPKADPDQKIPAIRDSLAGALTLVDNARVLVGVSDGGHVLIEAKAGTRILNSVSSDGNNAPTVSSGRANEHDVVFFDGGGADSLELPMRLTGKEYMPLAIGIVHAKGESFGRLRATQRRADGELSAGYEFRSSRG